MRIAAVPRFVVRRLSTEENLIDETIKLFLGRKTLPNPPPKSDESRTRGIRQRPQIRGVYLCMAAKLPEIAVDKR